MSKRNNCELQAETQRRKENPYKKKIFSPPASTDLSNVNKFQSSRDDIVALKEVWLEL